MCQKEQLGWCSPPQLGRAPRSAVKRFTSDGFVWLFIIRVGLRLRPHQTCPFPIRAFYQAWHLGVSQSLSPPQLLGSLVQASKRPRASEATLQVAERPAMLASLGALACNVGAGSFDPTWRAHPAETCISLMVPNGQSSLHVPTKPLPFPSNLHWFVWAPCTTPKSRHELNYAPFSYGPEVWENRLAFEEAL